MNQEKCWCGGTATYVGLPTQLRPRMYRCEDSKYHDPFATGKPDRIEVLYVAGPMSGYEECNYPAFNDAARVLEAAGYKVVNPASFGDGAHYVDFIREDLKLMLDCHGIAVLEGWWESTGARNEVQVGGILKMPTRTVNEWLERAHSELN